MSASWQIRMDTGVVISHHFVTCQVHCILAGWWTRTVTEASTPPAIPPDMSDRTGDIFRSSFCFRAWDITTGFCHRSGFTATIGKDAISSFNKINNGFDVQFPSSIPDQDSQFTIKLE